MTVAQPVVTGQVQRFLRRTRTLDGHRRLREQGAALLEVLHQLPGVGREVVAVIRGHAIAAKRFAEAFDGVPVELEARAYHQLFVADGATVIEDHQLSQGLETLYPRLDPLHPTRHGRSHGLRGTRGAEYAGADHGPAGLVVMHIGGVDERDVE
ncbi:hypothetical protein D3C80_1332550 [compost metagenome]